METKVVSFEQLPELSQNLVERIEALEKTVREKQQPQPLDGELMSVEDVCRLLGKSKSAVYRTVRYRDIPYIRQGNRLDFASATYSNCSGATLKWDQVRATTFASAPRKQRPRQHSPSATKHWNYAAKLRLNPQIPRKVDETKKPVTDWQLATFQNDYDPYRNPWMV